MPTQQMEPLMQTVNALCHITVGTVDLCGHEEERGNTGLPARMFKDVSGCELCESSVRSELWKTAIKTEFHFSINRFKQ